MARLPLGSFLAYWDRGFLVAMQTLSEAELLVPETIQSPIRMQLCVCVFVKFRNGALEADPGTVTKT